MSVTGSGLLYPQYFVAVGKPRTEYQVGVDKEIILSRSEIADGKEEPDGDLLAVRGGSVVRVYRVPPGINAVKKLDFVASGRPMVANKIIKAAFLFCAATFYADAPDARTRVGPPPVVGWPVTLSKTPS